MAALLHELIADSASRYPARPAVSYGTETLQYAELWRRVIGAAVAFSNLGLQRWDRAGIYLEKRLEAVISMFGIAAFGGVLVPINSVLKSRQVGYILRDCNVRVLVTSSHRLADLTDELGRCPDLRAVVIVDGESRPAKRPGISIVQWDEMKTASSSRTSAPYRVIDADMAAILYTSGSTGNPKGVVLSHRNMVAGALSVSQYLGNNADDRILSVLPLSFDAGLSQLTTAFAVGAEVVLMNYLLPRDVINLCADKQITGLTCVPPLWIQLAQLEWPKQAVDSLRYYANTGGRMPRATLNELRAVLPKSKPYLMYGLTEAFRSTYLDPAEIDRRPDSIGKAIPNAEILVVRPNGDPCEADEHGELVHRGALVALGYWNDPERTSERFRPAPGQPPGVTIPEIAVWSGDIVRRDAEGFLYFVGRRDELIKTSGYRVSPTEIEDVAHESGLVAEAAAVGLAHPTLGQAVALVAVARNGTHLEQEALLRYCQQQLPLYMVPFAVIERPSLPRTPNGKIDRRGLLLDLSDLFQASRP